MQTILQQSIATNYTATTAKTSIWKRFINWCDGQEKNHFGWLGAALATHGCISTPLTLFAIILSGNIFAFWIVAIAAMGASLITNLAAMPTKVTIPILFFSLVVDIAIIISCISIGLNVSAALGS